MKLHLVLSNFIKPTIYAGLLGVAFYQGSKHPGFADNIQKTLSREKPEYVANGIQEEVRIEQRKNPIGQIEQFLVDDDDNHLYKIMHDGMPDTQSMYDSLKKRVIANPHGDFQNHRGNSTELQNIIIDSYGTSNVPPSANNYFFQDNNTKDNSSSKIILGGTALALSTAGWLRYKHLKKNGEL